MAFVCVFFASCGKQKTPAEASDVAKREIHAVGYLEPPGEMRRLAFGEDGVIERVYVAMGDAVKQGDVLMELESRLQDLELVRAQSRHGAAVAEYERLRAGVHPDLIAAAAAKMKVAQEEMSHRKAEEVRFKSLTESGGAAQADIDEAIYQARSAEARWAYAKADWEALKNQPRKEELALAEAAVKVAEAEVVLARERKGRRVLKAPADGRILEIMKREGESYSQLAQDVALLMAPEGALLVRAEIDELDAHHLQPGMKAEITHRGGKTQTQGTIARVKPVMGRKTIFQKSSTERMDLQVMEAWIEVPPDEKWILGMEVDVVIREGEP